MKLARVLVLPLFFASVAGAAATAITYPAQRGAGAGRHLVFLTGDEEYRGEEGLPMLAKILSQRHGFEGTVLFALDPDGTINPDNNTSVPGVAALDSAAGIVMMLRFRRWPDAAMQHFADAVARGVPIVALRTSTQAFRFPPESTSRYKPFKWTRTHTNTNGKTNRVFCTTMGAATDLVNDGLRRMVVNAVLWGFALEIPAKTDVRFVDPYEPAPYAFKGYRRGLTPDDHALGQTLRAGRTP